MAHRDVGNTHEIAFIRVSAEHEMSLSAQLESDEPGGRFEHHTVVVQDVSAKDGREVGIGPCWSGEPYPNGNTVKDAVLIWDEEIARLDVERMRAAHATTNGRYLRCEMPRTDSEPNLISRLQEASG
jgi:hypothetical protein